MPKPLLFIKDDPTAYSSNCSQSPTIKRITVRATMGDEDNSVIIIAREYTTALSPIVMRPRRSFHRVENPIQHAHTNSSQMDITVMKPDTMAVAMAIALGQVNS